MALPLIAMATLIGATALHENTKHKYKTLEQLRKIKHDESESSSVIKSPSDSYTSNVSVKPVAGSIVCCEVFNFFDHTGVWIDQDTIIELSNNGLVKAVSAERFLDQRSGENIFIACNAQHEPLVIEDCAQRAINSVFSYREYDVIENNCHRFVHYCLSNNDIPISRFAKLNDCLLSITKQNIYWDKVKLS